MAPIDRIAQVIRQAVSGGMADSAGELNDAAAHAKPDVDGALKDTFGGGFSPLEVLGTAAAGIVDPAAAVAALGVLFGKASRWTFGVASGWAMGEFASKSIEPLVNYVVHEIWAAVPSQIFDPATAATLEAKSITMHETTMRADARGGGIDDDHYTALVAAAYTFPDLPMLIDLVNRGVIDDGAVIAALEKHGFPDNWINWLLRLKETLLSPGDIALAQLRGNMGDADAQAYAARLGVSAADLDILNHNTGEPPGPESLMEALRRNIIDETRFQHGIRQSRIRNEWIDVMDALKAHPMSIADAVRAVVENHIDEATGRKYAVENGLEADHFDILVKSWGRPLSHGEMMQLYHRGKATREQVDQALRESDVKNEYKDQAFELGTRLIPERTIVSMADHNVIGRDAGIAKLQELGFPEVDAARLMDLGFAQRKSTAKILSRGDILALYTDHLMKRTAAHDALVKLGYHSDDAAELLDLADYKLKASTLKATQRGIEASFKAHHLNEQEAKAQLIDAGMDSQQAQRLIDIWVAQRGNATKTLTQAQILRLGDHKLLSPDDVFARLVAEGLVEQDAVKLMQLHGIVLGNVTLPQ